MIRSAEVRWFFPDVPEEVDAFFRKKPIDYCSVEARTDHYLDIESFGGLSLKLRDGRMELKTLSAELGNYHFTPAITGKVEMWMKWSPQLKEGLETPAQVFNDHETFYAIEKVREMVKFELYKKGQLRAVKKDKTVAAGCQVELTRIDVAGTTLFSFGLEAFGRDEDLVNTLLLMARQVCGDFTRTTLKIEESYGYGALVGGRRWKST